MQEKIRTVGFSVSERLEEAMNMSPVAAYREMDEYIMEQSVENGVNIAVLTPEGEVVLPVAERLSDSERNYWLESETSSWS